MLQKTANRPREMKSEKGVSPFDIRALKCDIVTFKRLVSTLQVSEIIDEPAYIDGKLTYSLIKE